MELPKYLLKRHQTWPAKVRRKGGSMYPLFSFGIIGHFGGKTTTPPEGVDMP